MWVREVSWSLARWDGVQAFAKSGGIIRADGQWLFYRDSDVFLLFVSWPLPGIRPSCSMFSFTLVSHNVRILRFFSSSAFQLDALRVTRGNLSLIHI